MEDSEYVFIWYLIGCPGDSRRDRGTYDLDPNEMPDKSTDQNTAQPPHRLTTCFSVMSSLTSEQGIRYEFAMGFKVSSKKVNECGTKASPNPEN